jgi:sigma-B regulation protein RsbU (phosphoserine phosphatase)
VPLARFGCAKTQDGAFELSVANSGNPIPEAAIERLSQPSYRVAVERWVGLESARPHVGTLGVDSSPDETRFTFRMPVN